MTQNSLQVFKGGWEELESAVHTNNSTMISDLAQSLFIKPDGTSLFLITIIDQTIEEFALSIPWDISTISGMINSFDPSEVNVPIGLFFKSDGTKMFVGDSISNDIFEYALSIPWDISSIITSPVSLPNTASFSSITFSTLGDFLFLAGNVDVIRFPLPIPWDITSNVSNDLFTPTAGIVPSYLIFKPEGDKMFIGEQGNMKITEYDLSIPWDTTTSIPNGNVLDTSSMGNFSGGVMRSNGLELFLLEVFIAEPSMKLHLDDAWNISTASHFENNFALIIASGFPRAISWKPDGKKFIVAIVSGEVIDEYTVPNKWNTSGAIKTASFPIPGISVTGMWWSIDGRFCYVVGTNNEVITQLNVATQWDVSTMSNPGISFNLATVIPALDSVHGIYFTTDDNQQIEKLYAANFLTGIIYELNLTIHGDITSLVDSGNFINVNATGRPADILLSPDRKNMFYPTTDGDKIVRYKLSIPGDISSAVFADSRITSSEGENSPQGLFIRQTDGKKVYVVGFSMKNVISYDMSLEFNFGIIDNLGNRLIDNLGNLLVYQ